MYILLSQHLGAKSGQIANVIVMYVVNVLAFSTTWVFL